MNILDFLTMEILQLDEYGQAVDRSAEVTAAGNELEEKLSDPEMMDLATEYAVEREKAAVRFIIRCFLQKDFPAPY